MRSMLCWLALSLSVASCAVMRTDSDYDRAADFSKFHRYVWMTESAVIQSRSARVEISPLTVRRIREAIEAELKRRGFERVDVREDADFAVAFTVGARDMISIEDYPPYYRGEWGWGPPYYWPNVDVSMYTEGMLAIDIFDVAMREPVWHGWARKEIVGADLEDPESAIDAAVAAILAKFPPPASPPPALPQA
jgi:hypothetical protein